VVVTILASCEVHANKNAVPSGPRIHMADHTLTLSNGLTLGYAEYGDPAGAAMFYFHGWPSGRVQGELMYEAGLKYGLRIIAPDRPGIGLSDFQPRRRLLDWPPVLEELAAHAGAEKFHVLGWSGGGPYVLATALKMPARLLSATIVCGAPPLAFFGDAKMFWLYRLMIRLRGHFPSVLGAVLRLGALLARGSPDKPPLKWLMRLLLEPDRRVLADPEVFRVVRAGMMESLRRGPRAVIGDADIYLSEWGFEVSSVTFPVHLWHGKMDRNIAWEYSAQLAELMPHADIHWLENEGHYSLPILHNDAILRHALGLGAARPPAAAAGVPD